MGHSTAACAVSVSDSTPCQLMTPLPTTVTTICHLPVSSALSMTGIHVWNSVAFPHLTIWCLWSRPPTIPNAKSHSFTQRSGPALAAEAALIATCPLSSQASAQTRQPHANRLACPGFVSPCCQFCALRDQARQHVECHGWLGASAAATVISPTTISSTKLLRSCQNY